MRTSRIAPSVWTLLLAAGALAAGCGDLRKRPLVAPQDGGNLDAPVDQFVPDGPTGDLVFSDAPTDTTSSGCVTGAACLPANPCHEGEIVCTADGGSSCTDTSRPQANGTVCGTNRVCRDGACVDCAADTACPIAGKPCRVGTVSCSTGEAVCTESDNRPNGAACGTGMVCQAGACVACQNGAACTPSNVCHDGMLDCSTGTAVCMDRATNKPAGTSCGQNMVCNATGACTACTAGATCPIPGRPCRTGTTTCNTGAATCVESGNAPDGTGCGANMVCSNGSCVSCTANLSCVPTNPCRTGVTACSPTPTCMMTTNAVPNGTSCGVDRVCNAGTCSACVSGAACQPANVCKLGATSCATGSSVCAESANVPNGTPCGTNLVCMGGTCSACSAGSACTPTNPCHTGTLSCATGTPVCTDTGQSVSDGTSCGTNQVCRSGQCVACTAGGACQPANPCKYGTVSCATGAAVCVESGNKPVGTTCGAAQSCANGVKRSAEMCNANQQCTFLTMNCSTGACNAAGTDCASCAAGETSCPTLGCRNLSTDPSSCGGCGNRCPDPPVVGSGSPTCSNGTCDVSCNPGFVKCVGIDYCENRGWGFEDGTTGGFGILRTDFPMAVRSISASSAQSHSGKYSLALAIAARGDSRAFEIGLSLCAGKGYVPGTRQMVSAWFYIEPSGILLPGAPALPPGSRFGEQLYTENRPGGNMVTVNEVRNWFYVSTPVESLGSQLYQLAVAGVFEIDGSGRSDWEGTVYVDDIQISTSAIIGPPLSPSTAP